MIDHQREIIEERIAALPAFGGRKPEEYAFLINPFVKFALDNRYSWKEGFVNLEALNNLAQNILGANKPEVIPTRAEPTITAKFLATQIKPWVDDIRESLFHSKLPFDSVGDAEAWLNEVRQKLPERIKKIDRRLEKYKRHHAYWRILCEKYSLPFGEYDGWRVPPIEHPTQEELQLFTEEEQHHIMSLKPGKSFREDKQVKAYIDLSNNARKISEATGFTSDSVIMHILTHSSPVLPSLTYSITREAHALPSGVNLLNCYARITIRGDVSIAFQDLYLLYRRIRRELKIKRMKHLSKENIELYELVGQEGDIPTERGRAKAFWESKLGKWNNSHPRRKYNTAQVLKITYRRVVARLERMVIRNEG